MTSTVNSCKEFVKQTYKKKTYEEYKKQMKANKKQIKKDKKNQQLLKNKEYFMKMKGYRIKVGEDSYIVFKNEENYLVMLYFENVFFDFHKQLFNGKEVISLLFRLNTFKVCLKNCRNILR